jgi:hypothetical protein
MDASCSILFSPPLLFPLVYLIGMELSYHAQARDAVQHAVRLTSAHKCMISVPADESAKDVCI